MCPDEEVGEDRFACASGATIGAVGASREECRGDGDRLDDGHRRQGRPQVLDAGEARCDLGENDGVDDDRAALGGIGELELRPV